MSILVQLKPRRRDRIMDIVQAAGLDVSEWARSSTGASNPKYCYEWAFSDEARSNIVLCLWYEECEIDADGRIVQRGNVRPLILRLEGQGSPRARRARLFDELLQDAWRLASSIRVALVDRSDTEKLVGAEQDFAEFRELDSVRWRLDHYNMMTGDYVLRREPSPSAGLSLDPADGIERLNAADLPATVFSRNDGIAGSSVSAQKQMDYVCRVVYSDNGWVRPASASKEADNSFASSRGFGHEEWLFRDEWTIGGWRYAFLQGINKSYKRLCRVNAPLSLTLFTLDPKVGHRYVARIFGAEVVRAEDAERAMQEFRLRGWLDIMRAEISAVGGHADSLGNDVLAPQILNVRYRPDRVERLIGMPIAAKDDPIRRVHRYMLYNSKNIGVSHPPMLPGGREPTTSSYFRNGAEPSWITPEHGRMQEILRAELRAEYPDATVRCEVNGIDLLLESSKERVLFEVKSELCTRRVIREALGQIMEYAYYRDNDCNLTVRLVVVGRSSATEDDIEYLSLLRARFGIPIEYRQVKLDCKSHK